MPFVVYFKKRKADIMLKDSSTNLPVGVFTKLSKTKIWLLRHILHVVLCHVFEKMLNKSLKKKSFYL
jgi:hypothetical protein